MKHAIASFIAFCSFIQIVSAQDDHIRPAAIGASFILNDFTTASRIRSGTLNNVFREKRWATIKEMSPGLALSYFKGVHRHIDFAATLGASFVNYPLPNKPLASDDALLLELDATANFKMLPEKYWFTPYLIAGVGASKYKYYYGAFMPLGGGLKINFFDEAAIFINTTYRVPVTAENTNYHFNYNFGIAGVVGKRKPRVIPPPPPPPDRDGDGLVDVTDSCPDVPGLAKYNGCPVPDTDKDGINDEEDKCPTVVGTARYNGCPVPDTDNDGINDEEDKCPSVAGVARYQGCPVPDRDNDGINDEEDQCPDVAGIAANRGCPEIKQEVINRINYAAKNIFFATGSSRLLNTSNKALNEVYKILTEDPNLKLSIEGHTDNVGKEDYNHTLSHDRANSVRSWLLNKGIDESRLEAIGYGMTKPVADNKTAAGRAKNRRVEMKLTYQ